MIGLDMKSHLENYCIERRILFSAGVFGPLLLMKYLPVFAESAVFAGTCHIYAKFNWFAGFLFQSFFQFLQIISPQRSMADSLELKSSPKDLLTFT